MLSRFSGSSIAIPLLLLARSRRRLVGWPRRRGGVDLQHLPGSLCDVRLAGPGVDGDCAVFKLAPLPCAEPLRHKLDRTAECGPPLTARQHDLRLHNATLHPRLDTDTGQPEVRIECPHPHRHRCRWRHAGRRFPRLLDRDLGSEIGLNLDPVLEFLCLHLFPPRERRAAGLKEEPIRRMLGRGPFGIHLHDERTGRPCQIARPHLELQVAAAVTLKIDPCRFERLVALGDDHDTRTLDGPQVALPGHRLALAVHIRGKFIEHLPHQERRCIDERHVDRLAPGITCLDRERHRLIEATGCVGQYRGIPLFLDSLTADAGHLGPPRHRGTVHDTAIEQRRYGNHRPLVGPQTADHAVHHQLPATHERGSTLLDLDTAGIVRITAVGRRLTAGTSSTCNNLFSRHPPRQPGRLKTHPCRRHEAGPRRQQPGRGRQQALGRGQRIDACQSHEQSQCIGQPNRQ